jgi:hypothetical protein
MPEVQNISAAVVVIEFVVAIVIVFVVTGVVSGVVAIKSLEIPFPQLI